MQVPEPILYQSNQVVPLNFLLACNFVNPHTNLAGNTYLHHMTFKVIIHRQLGSTKSTWCVLVPLIQKTI